MYTAKRGSKAWVDCHRPARRAEIRAPSKGPTKKKTDRASRDIISQKWQIVNMAAGSLNGGRLLLVVKYLNALYSLR